VQQSSAHFLYTVNRLTSTSETNITLTLYSTVAQLLNLEAHYRIHKSPPFFHFPSHTDQLHTSLPSYSPIGVRKSKVHPTPGHEGTKGGLRYSSTLSLTSTLDGVVGQRHAPAVLLPGKTQYPLHRRLGGPPGPVWTGAGNLAPHRDSIP
jgi:hypothetical protein